jgi:hypothetical protein
MEAFGEWEGLTDTDQDDRDDRLDRMQSPERLAPVHLEVGRSPEDKSEPASEEGRDWC